MELYANGGVFCMLVSGSSLFLGLNTGDIVEWQEPGEVRRTLNGHTQRVLTIMQCGNVLWSGSRDNTIKQWDTHTGECINTIPTDAAVYNLCEWKGHVISEIGFHVSLVKMDGTMIKAHKTGHAPTVWKEHLCIGSENDILLWKEWNVTARKFSGHSDYVISLAPAGEYLFSGSHDATIRQWNEQGECLVIMNHHTESIWCLLVHNGQLYSGASDNTLKRWNIQGQMLDDWRQNSEVWCFSVWRGAVFSGGSENMIRWTSFSAWSPSNHHLFSRRTRDGIKTMMLMASKRHFPSDALPMAILYIIFQFFAAGGRSVQNHL